MSSLLRKMLLKNPGTQGPSFGNWGHWCGKLSQLVLAPSRLCALPELALSSLSHCQTFPRDSSWLLSHFHDSVFYQLELTLPHTFLGRVGFSKTFLRSPSVTGSLWQSSVFLSENTVRFEKQIHAFVKLGQLFLPASPLTPSLKCVVAWLISALVMQRGSRLSDKDQSGLWKANWTPPTWAWWYFTMNTSWIKSV